MSKNQSSLHTLINIESVNLSKAEESLALANQAVVDAEVQYVQLQDYRADYDRQNKASMASGISIGALKNNQNFIKKLDDAIVGQHDLVERTKRIANSLLDNWKECKKKTLSYEILLKQHQEKQRVVESKRDQKLMDEFASRSKNLAH